MKIVGLTGGIGSGKSTVLEMFNKLGVEVFIADIEAKKLMNTNAELINEIKQLLGKNAYLNNELNSAFIASIVFTNKDKLAALNKLVHPKVAEHFKNFIKMSKAQIIMYESAILFESGIDKMCNLTISVTANLDDKIERVMKRDGTTKKQILDRMKNQLNDEIKIKKSKFVINNTSLEVTKQQVSTIYSLITKL